MAAVSSGPWRQVTDGERQGRDGEPDPYAGTHLGMFADLFYRMASERGFTPTQVRAMLVWEAAAVLGSDVNRSVEKDAPDGTDVAPSSRNLIAERLAHKRGQGPKPVPDRTNPAMMAELTNTMAGNRGD